MSAPDLFSDVTSETVSAPLSPAQKRLVLAQCSLSQALFDLRNVSVSVEYVAARIAANTGLALTEAHAIAQRQEAEMARAGRTPAQIAKRVAHWMRVVAYLEEACP
jgi:hypothetical protein